MSVDASAVARVLGIETVFENLTAGDVLFLPQRIAIIAQGASASVYSTAKAQLTSAGAAGLAYGWGSPIHLLMRQLFPANGDGVGTIPVTVYPLADAGAGVAAVGAITPTGSQTTQASYRVSISNILSEPFVIAVGESITSVCTKIAEAINAVLEMPTIATYTYGTVTAAPDDENTGDGTVGTLSVTGTPTPGDYTLACTVAAADAGTFSLTGPDGTVIAAALAVGDSPFDEGGIAFAITDGAADFIVGDSFTITVPATAVSLAAKWKGASGNAIYVEVVGEDLGVTFAMTQPTGGLVNPDITAALALIGNVWESMVLNALDIDDSDALDVLRSVGEGRWGELVRKPFVAFTGNTATAVADATAVSELRRDDRVNAQLVAPGSKDLPFVVCARQLARIAKVANNNPPTDYGSQRATGLTPGDDGDQWNYASRDQAVKAGSSTVEVRDGVVHVADVVTFYRPEGEPIPAYRHVVDIVKLQNILFNIDLIFAVPAWDGAPLIPDSQPTVNPLARKPKSAVAAVRAKIDSLGLQAIISDPKTAKAAVSASISSSNPKRLDVDIPLSLSGNTNIISARLRFSFFFGSSAVVG